MNNSELINELNARTPGFIGMLGGTIMAVDAEQKSCTFEFVVSHDFCHSVDIIQGGFITAMLDAAMSHAAFATGEDIIGLSSLEIKTSYLEPSRAGRLRAEGRIIKAGYKLAFLEAQLFDDSGLLTATASSVAKLTRNKS